MRPRSSDFLGWSSLPPEIRSTILNTIVDQRNSCWAALASVSKEWHSIIGVRNMAKLKLRQSCLEGFGRVIVRQRDLVKHIYLKIELPEYNFETGSNVAPAYWFGSNRNDTCLVSDTIKHIFDILSTWETTGPLTLELNATSPSDSMHWFKNFRFDDDHDAYDRNTPVRAPMEPSWHDPPHGWENGSLVRNFDDAAMYILLAPFLDCDFGKDLAKVDAVTCLMIRRQLRHCFLPTYLGDLLEKLGRLTDFIFEPWPEPYPEDKHPNYGNYESFLRSNSQGLLSMPFPKTIKRMIVFRDCIPRLRHPRLYLSCEDSAMAEEENSKNIARTSLRLEELAVSFLIEARQFSNACNKEWTWDYLESLALTPLVMQEGEKYQRPLQKLLIDTAKLALRMPKLKALVLWRGFTGKACAFMYTRTELCADITVRGTWELVLSQDVLEAWEDVAKFHSVYLKVRHERIKEVITSHGDAIYHLDLPCQVIEPTSLWQIRMENL